MLWVATWWGWYLCFCCIEKDSGERVSHFVDVFGLRGLLGEADDNPIRCSRSIYVKSEVLPIELSSGFSRQYAFVGCDMATEVGLRVYRTYHVLNLPWLKVEARGGP